jgi:tetratricopeptide (TPR) repeat protein
LARSHRALAGLSYRRGSLREAEQSYRAAIRLEERLVSELPGVPAYRLELAETRNDLGVVLQAGNRLAEAEALHREALSLRQSLAEEFPRMPYYQREMATGQGYLADLLQQADRLPEAEQALGHAITIAEKLATDYPKQPEYRTYWAEYLGRLGTLLLESARPREATRAFCQGLEQRQQLAAEFPATSAERDLAWFLATCPDPDFRDIKRAQALARKAVEAAPKDGLSWTTLGVAQYRAGAWEAAAAALEKAVQLGGADNRAPVFLAMTHWQRGRPREARECLTQDRAWQKGYRPGTGELRRLDAEARSLLGQTDR